MQNDSNLISIWNLINLTVSIIPSNSMNSLSIMNEKIHRKFLITREYEWTFEIC